MDYIVTPGHGLYSDTWTWIIVTPGHGLYNDTWTYII